MLRSDIKNIVNELSLQYSIAARAAAADYQTLLSFELLKCYDVILNYCKVNKTRPRANNYKQDNGLLFINNVPAARVGLRYNKPDYKALSFCGIDCESLILARQEALIDD